MRRRIVELLLVAAAAAGCGGSAPRNGWDRAWGPLVPHRTFPADCSLCHTSSDWSVLRDDFRYDHEAETGFALAGAHAAAACLRCHNDHGPVAEYVARGCAGCHFDPHRAELGPDCTRCHGEVAWEPDGLVAAHALTRFPLAGAHLAVACELCHPAAPAGDYRGAPLSCERCHLQDALDAVSIDHAASGFTSSCDECHGISSWRGAAFRHTAFPLTAGHSGLDCVQCHTSGVYGPIPSDCNSCHSDDYDATVSPDHAALGYPRTCEACHTTAAWTTGG